MGSFQGHALPSALFFLMGSWWSFGTWRYYFAGVQPFQSTASFPAPRCSRCVCLEGWCKVIAAFIGVTGEIYTAFEGGSMKSMANVQHATMYAFYGVSGIVDILVRLRTPLPPKTDYALLVLVTVVEGFLFKFHLHGRPPLDTEVHTFIVYVCVIQALFIALEMNNPRNVFLALGRAYCVVLQATWFLQVGFILHNPLPSAVPWDVHDVRNMTLAASIFTWHMLGVLFYIALMGWLVRRCRSVCSPRLCIKEETYKLIPQEETVPGPSGDGPKWDRQEKSDEGEPT